MTGSGPSAFTSGPSYHRRASAPKALGSRATPESFAVNPNFLLVLLATAITASVDARGDEPEDGNTHVQATYVRQAKPAFASPYEGRHSLIGAREWSYSLTGTVAVGARLGNTEAYVDGEVAQGVPFSGLQGLAGFTNGELARTSGANPTFYRARAFVRHVFGLGGESESVDSAANQLASRYDRNRVVITAGNVSVLDLFDANAFSHDPRTQFMNWTLMTHGAWDYPADSRGYTWGAAAEYFGARWSVRAGRFAQPEQPNGLKLDSRIPRHFGDQVELSRDYAWGEQAGTVRLLAFRNRAVMARYDDALASAAAGAPPDLASVRTREHTKSGFGVGLEHRIAPGLGIFGRVMGADGKTETYAFTEVDRSASAGLSCGGARWGREADTAGLAMALNALSASHRGVLQAGGQTFFLGDGRLRYRPEQVLEAYYSVGLLPGVALTLDYQRISNPGYNADRGPASFVALRLHVEK